jgi:hypothetical protein
MQWYITYISKDMMMAVDRGGLTWFVTGTEEMEGVGEAHVEEQSHLCFAAIEQAFMHTTANAL